jgi:transposase-like protein
MFLIRGIVFTHEAVRDWEARLAPMLTEGLRKRRVGKAQCHQNSGSAISDCVSIGRIP